MGGDPPNEAEIPVGRLLDDKLLEAGLTQTKRDKNSQVRTS